ncbi:hypothetical protein SAMN05660703_1817 [Cellulophaga tyrosinoxydans]|jgi:hypothetical protein|uniref:Uncharacterized protein n=1 Tax=Cellulophaga tyrosinoxydans TaxID=504486 RepID=A0A1W2A5A0_9FLAO|nr:hypothetical protein SAMN05660703_1817 [Cellulophaga tyrosinoxydans]
MHVYAKMDEYVADYPKGVVVLLVIVVSQAIKNVEKLILQSIIRSLYLLKICSNVVFLISLSNDF